MVELIEFRAKKFDDKLPLLQSEEESEQCVPLQNSYWASDFLGNALAPLTIQVKVNDIFYFKFVQE